MLKLGLIGKNINHSKSPEIYQELLDEKHSYEVLDYSDETLIPSLDELSQNFSGLNITSPYKKYFWDKVTLNRAPKGLKCINCLKFSDKIEGLNTDYLALKDLILEKHFKTKKFLILGDGNMAHVLKEICHEMEIHYQQTSRKLHENFPMIETDSNTLVVNTCAREYIYNGRAVKDQVFWDLNYNHPGNLERCQELGFDYLDGMTLLKKQAEYALDFWKA